MTTHFSILAWRIPWTEESGELSWMGSHRVSRRIWSLEVRFPEKQVSQASLEIKQISTFVEVII